MSFYNQLVLLQHAITPSYVATFSPGVLLCVFSDSQGLLSNFLGYIYLLGPTLKY